MSPLQALVYKKNNEICKSGNILNNFVCHLCILVISPRRAGHGTRYLFRLTLVNLTWRPHRWLCAQPIGKFQVLILLNHDRTIATTWYSDNNVDLFSAYRYSLRHAPDRVGLTSSVQCMLWYCQQTYIPRSKNWECSPSKKISVKSWQHRC